MAYIVPSTETSGAITATSDLHDGNCNTGPEAKGLHSLTPLLRCVRAAATPTIPRNVFFTRSRTSQNTITTTGIEDGDGQQRLECR